MVPVAPNPYDTTIFNGGDDAARVRTIAIADGFSSFDHVG
jgi:hypothetical protein